MINEEAWENPTGIDILEIPKLEVNPTTTTDTLTSIKINGVSYAISGANVDLTEYAKKTDIPDVSHFISEIPSEYVTESELNAKGYLTSVAWGDVTGKPTLATVATSGSYNDLTNKPTIPSIEGLATEQYVNNAIANIPGGGGGGSDVKEVFCLDMTEVS